MRVEKAVLITIAAIIIFTAFFVKYLGSTDITYEVEKDGFCKQYGEEWRNKKGLNECYNPFNPTDEHIIFTDKDFRNECSKNKFISTNFYSDCFYESDGIGS